MESLFSLGPPVYAQDVSPGPVLEPGVPVVLGSGFWRLVRPSDRGIGHRSLTQVGSEQDYLHTNRRRLRRWGLGRPHTRNPTLTIPVCRVSVTKRF